MEKEILNGVIWIHHASFCIKKQNKVIYIDPWELRDNIIYPADIILVTHEHFDHFSFNDIKKILKEGTSLYIPQSMFGKIDIEIEKSEEKLPKFNIHYVNPGDKREEGEIKIEVVPAYNINKKFHPKKSKWVGYIIEVEGTRYYHAGDTDFIPEMKEIKTDVAFLPIGGTYTMDVEDGIKASKSINAKLFIPMHWGKLVGTKEDAEKFKNKVGEKAYILNQGLKK